jgi:cytidine deaminase
MQYTELIGTASAARLRAYVPYSGVQVGAALATKAGKIYGGCNIENVSLGLTICAERSAVATAIAHDSKDFAAIAVVTSGKRQRSHVVLAGKCRPSSIPNMKIPPATIDGKVQEFDLAELLPFSSQGILEGSRDV